MKEPWTCTTTQIIRHAKVASKRREPGPSRRTAGQTRGAASAHCGRSATTLVGGRGPYFATPYAMHRAAYPAAINIIYSSRYKYYNGKYSDRYRCRCFAAGQQLTVHSAATAEPNPNPGLRHPNPRLRFRLTPRAASNILQHGHRLRQRKRATVKKDPVPSGTKAGDYPKLTWIRSVEVQAYENRDRQGGGWLDGVSLSVSLCHSGLSVSQSVCHEQTPPRADPGQPSPLTHPIATTDNPRTLP